MAFDSAIDYQLIHNFEGEIIKEYEYMPVVLVEFSKKSASSISKESDILYIEKDGEVTITSLTQAELSTQTIPWNIDKVNNSFTPLDGYKGAGIKVGIIDTGIDYTRLKR